MPAFTYSVMAVVSAAATMTAATMLVGNTTSYVVDSTSFAPVSPVAWTVSSDATASQPDTHVKIDITASEALGLAASTLSMAAWWAAVALTAIATLMTVAVSWTLTTIGWEGTRKIGQSVSLWWRGLAHYWLFGRTYADFPYLKDDAEARVYIRSIALAMTLWSLPHYRNGNFQEDMEKNLRNVAIPGTGVPLSVFCRSKARFYFAVLVLAPLACLYAAMTVKDDSKESVADRFKTFLLSPQDWFTLWRINCCLASYHAHTTGSDNYRVEDKWTFLQLAEEKGIAVSPTLQLPAIVVKDRNEEGGMGIQFFANARHGGDWIIQKVLGNGRFVSALLPEKAPLSTIRIVTASRAGLAADGGESNTHVVEPLSCVVRLGRAGALTDHDAILFDADLDTGVIRNGTVNKSWYKLGWNHVTLRAPEGPALFTSHPDSGVPVTGKVIPGMDEIRELVTRAHLECCPDVPLCGWDVALSDEGTLLLEVNLSCNFFQATIDRANYFRFVDSHFRQLEQTALAK